MTDDELIRKTLTLAKKGQGHVSPNPMVGAVIVKDNRVIGEGYHRRFGLEHAEVVALNSARESASGGSLYVNLEPCSHFGKQPPCVDRIVESGIRRVVVGTLDPNPRVQGRGIRFLLEHGIEVVSGVLEKKCHQLNAPFFKHVTTGLPLVTLKIAQTLDGRITASDGGSKWISSRESRKVTHKLRREHDVILAGIGTVLKDDPQLNVRLVDGQHPTRVVLDSGLRIPLAAKLLNDSLVQRTIIATTAGRECRDKCAQLERKGARLWQIPMTEANQVDLTALCQKLGQEGFTSVLVEGGARVFSSFLRAGLVDKLAIFVAPKILGAGLSAVQNLGVEHLQDCIQLVEFSSKKVGQDILLTGSILSNGS
ncbi:MAG: bifunctional diaminohydroxyphosphoribosylaminopyrimidine deaminase/5-amino-6-(5-phosphoribosylamino)uracil reductase RibD [bacterium]